MTQTAAVSNAKSSPPAPGAGEGSPTLPRGTGLQTVPRLAEVTFLRGSADASVTGTQRETRMELRLTVRTYIV